MREPQKLDKLYDTFKNIHKDKLYDIRFGQFLYIF